MPKKQIPEGFKNPSGALFSPVLQIGNHFHFSGLVPNLDENKKPISTDLADQTREVLTKIKDGLSKCGLKPDDLFDVTISFIGQADEYNTINQVYADFLKTEDIEDPPIRFATAAAWLPFGVLVEFKVIAVKQD